MAKPERRDFGLAEILLAFGGNREDNWLQSSWSIVSSE